MKENFDKNLVEVTDAISETQQFELVLEKAMRFILDQLNKIEERILELSI